MDLKNLSAEEICSRINIQGNLIDLQSKNREKRDSALTTLAAISELAKRKDALYALCGYYILEVESTDDLESFFDAIRTSVPVELLILILKDLAKDKNIYRRRILIDDFIRSLSSSIFSADDKDKAEIKQLIENSVWGEKLKRKFLYNLDKF